MRLRAAPEEVGARWDAIPPPLRAALKPFQAEGVEFALRRRGWALIADEMGLGKTIQVRPPLLKRPTRPGSAWGAGSTELGVPEDALAAPRFVSYGSS